MNNSVLVLR